MNAINIIQRKKARRGDPQRVATNPGSMGTGNRLGRGALQRDRPASSFFFSSCPLKANPGRLLSREDASFCAASRLRSPRPFVFSPQMITDDFVFPFSATVCQQAVSSSRTPGLSHCQGQPADRSPMPDRFGNCYLSREQL